MRRNIRKAVVPGICRRRLDGRPLKAGLIGCGGRGTGAAVNFRDAGNGLTVTMLADIFPDKLDACRKTLKGKGDRGNRRKLFPRFRCL